jgi:hypothetical protein
MNEDVLHEFLVKLGFKVDNLAQSKMEGSIMMLTKRAAGLVSGLLAVTAAAEVMVKSFSTQMEKLFYASQQTGDSAGHLQAFARAAKQIGIDGDEALEFVKNFDLALKANPGLQQLLSGMGVKGGDDTEKLFSFIKKLKGMPDSMAFQFASQFGVNPSSYLRMKNNLPEMEKYYEQEKKRQAENGTDVGEQARKMREFDQQLAKVSDSFTTLGQQLAVFILPVLTKINELLDSAIKASSRTPKQIADSRNQFSKDHPVFAKLAESLFGAPPPAGPTAVPSVTYGKTTAKQQFEALQKKYGVPAEILYKMWGQESNYGRNMGPSKAGALGHMQFLPGTGADYGLKNPGDHKDFYKSTDAGGRYMRDLLGRHHGDMAMALAAYNWGEGNLQKYGLGRAPAETRKYLNNILGAGNWDKNGMVQHNTTKIDVHSTAPANEVGRAVADKQSDVNARAARNLGGRIQ